MGIEKAQVTKPSSTMKRFIDAGKKNTRVLTAVERYVLSKPADTSRRTDVLHPSAMAKSSWCYRASYFEILGHVSVSKYKTGFKTRLIFDEGHRIHNRWQTWFKEMGTLYGKWFCTECRTSFVGLAAQHDQLHFNNLVYKEVSVYSEEHNISGHSDGILLDMGDPLLLEIKSVGEGTFLWEDRDFYAAHDNEFKAAWEHLTAPFQTHIQQAQIYLKLLELMDAPYQPQEAVFIYEAKPNQEVKEFVVPKSDFSVLGLFDAAKMIKMCVESKTPPPCNMRGEALCKDCKGFEDATD